MRVNFICKTSIFSIVALSMIAALFLTGCQVSAPPARETTVPPQTTAAPTTTAPAKEEVSVELVFAMLDEAAEILDTNETVALSTNQYLLTYIGHMFPEGVDGLTIADDLITIQNTDDLPLWEQFRYLVFLSFLTERYPEYLITYSEVYGTGPEVNSYRPDAFYFFSGFDDRGYETIQEFYADNVRHYVPSGTTKLSISFESVYIYIAYDIGDLNTYLIHSINGEETLYKQHLESK